MDDLLTTIITNAPNLMGVGFAAWVLYQQVNKLTDALLVKIDVLERKVDALAQKVENYEFME